MTGLISKLEIITGSAQDIPKLEIFTGSTHIESGKLRSGGRAINNPYSAKYAKTADLFFRVNLSQKESGQDEETRRQRNNETSSRGDKVQGKTTRQVAEETKEQDNKQPRRETRRQEARKGQN